jgi:hypothetical protein
MQLLEEFRRQHLAADALVVALNGSSVLALAFGGRLFVELASAQFGQQTGFSTARLKRRMATSNGSFSLTRIFGIDSSILRF